MNKKRYKKDEFVIGKDFWDTGTPPPSSDELEEMVLGAVIIEYTALSNLGADFSPNLFHKAEHKIIANAIIEMWHDNKSIDTVTVFQHLHDTKKIQESGGPGYLASLTNKIASTAHLEYHVRILQEMSLKRFITELCAVTMKRIYSTNDDVFEVYSDLQMQMDESIKSVLRYEIESVGSINEETIKEQREVIESGNPPGVISGMVRVDRVTNGWQKSDLIILAGRPGMGKTAFAISAILEPSINLKKPIGVFSLEMSKKQLTGRIQAQLTGINVSRITKKQLSKEELTRLEEQTMLLNDAPIYIDDTPSISLIELTAKARKMVRENGVEMIVVDYLQLMRSGMNIQNREQEISQISRGLKAIAKELDIPVIALAQLSRSVEARGGDKKPMLSDLRESGQIEQDADMVGFCYRPEYYGIEDYQIDMHNYSANGLFMLLIAKHRNGSLGEIPLAFIHELARIQNHADDSSDNSNTFVQRKSVDGITENSGGIKPNTDFEQSNVDNPTTTDTETDGDEIDWLNPEEDDLPF